MYVDVRENTLFVGYATEGIQIYNIEGKSLSLLGTVSKAYFDDLKNHDDSYGSSNKSII